MIFTEVFFNLHVFCFFVSHFSGGNARLKAIVVTLQQKKGPIQWENIGIHRKA